MDLKEQFRKALLEEGIDIRTIIHWADSEVKRGYCSENYPDNYYLKVSTEHMGVYKADDVLVVEDGGSPEKLEALAKHFSGSIEPVEIFI